jgi:hypothetical protein
MFVITAHGDKPPPEAHVAIFTKPFPTGQLMTELERLHEARRRG